MWTGKTPHNEKATFLKGNVAFVGVIVIAVCTIFIPLPSAWPFVAPKQLLLVIGASLTITHLIWISHRQLESANRSAFLFLAIWIGGLIVRSLLQPANQLYESLWGISVRGDGLITVCSAASLTMYLALASPMPATSCFAIFVRSAFLPVALYGTLQFLGIDFINAWDRDPQYLATLGNLSISTMYYAIATSIFVWLSIRSRHYKGRFWRMADGVFGVWSALLCIAGYRHGGSQGVFFLCVLAALCAIKFAYESFRHKQVTSRTALTYGAAFTLIVTGVLVGVWLTFTDHGASDRVQIWRIGFGIVKVHPWIGIGFAQLPNQWDFFRLPSDIAAAGWNRPVDHVHNSFLQLAIVAGLPITIAYFSWTIILCCLAWRAIDVRVPTVRGLSAFIFLGSLIFELLNPLAFPMTALGATAAGFLLIPGTPLSLERRQDRVSRLIKVRWLLSVFLGFFAVSVVWPRISSEFRLSRSWYLDRSTTQSISKVRQQVAVGAQAERLRTLIELRPYDSWLRIVVGSKLIDVARVEEAASVYEAGTQLQPEVTRFWLNLALCRMLSFQPARAVAILDTALKKAPLDVPSALHRQIAAQSTGDLAAIRRTSMYVDELGRRVSISSDSMRTLHDQFVAQLDQMMLQLQDKIRLRRP